MKNIFKFLRDKMAEITVQDNIITIKCEDGQSAVFEGNKDNYCIEYNTGNLGGGIYCESGIFIEINAEPTDFINGKKYIIENIELSKNTQNKKQDGCEHTYGKVFLELMTETEKFSDIKFRADVIKVYVNGEILQDKPRRIFAGYYKRYDGGLHFYVIRVVPDLITGEDVILCRKDSFNDFSYFVLSRKEFDAKVDCGGKKIKKYYRNTRQNPISDK